MGHGGRVGWWVGRRCRADARRAGGSDDRADAIGQRAQNGCSSAAIFLCVLCDLCVLCARVRCVREQQIENAKRNNLGERTSVADGTDASRAAVFARALGNQRARVRQQLVVHLIQRRAEADAARIVVVDEDLLRVGDAAGDEVSVTGIDGDADVVGVAHQEQLRDLLQRECQTDHAVAPVVGRIRQPRHHARRNRQPVPTSYASAVPADPARPIRRSRSCRT